MVDLPIPGAAAPVPEPAPVAAPVVAAAAPEPAPAPAPAAPLSPEPAASPAPAGEGSSPAPAGAAAPNAHSEPTLLEKFSAEAKAAEAAKPVIAPVVDPAKPAEVKLDAEGKPIVPDPAAAPEPVQVQPIEYKYEVPETLKISDEQRGEFKSALDTYRADPTNPQALVDLHNKALEKYAADLSVEQHKVWNDTRQEWRNAVLSDPVIGGNGIQTAMAKIGRMRDMFVTPDRAKSFEDMLRVTGVGDHPEFLHFVHNVARKFDEPALPPTGAKPSPNNGKPPGRGRLYDHPTSQPK